MVHNTVDQKGPSSGLENAFSFDFEMATGEVHTKNTITFDNVLYCYGLEFSSNSDELYIGVTNEISDETEVSLVYQVCYRNEVLDYNPIQFIGGGTEPIYSLQLAIDVRFMLRVI